MITNPPNAAPAGEPSLDSRPDGLEALLEQAITEARQKRAAAAQQLIDRASALLDPDSPPPIDRIRVILARAYLAYYSGDPALAEQIASAAAEAALDSSLPALAARCLAFRTIVVIRYDGEARWRQVLGWLGEVERLLAADAESDRRFASERSYALYLHELGKGTVEHYVGRTDLALDAYQRALDHCTRRNDSIGVCALHHRIAYLETARLRERWFEQELRPGTARPVIDPADRVHVESLLRRSLEHAQLHGVMTNWTSDKLGLAFLARLDGRTLEALAILDQALASYAPDGFWPAEASLAMSDRVLCLLSLGRLNQALADSAWLVERQLARAAADAETGIWRARQAALAAQGDDAGASDAESRALLAWDRYVGLRQAIRESIKAENV